MQFKQKWLGCAMEGPRKSEWFPVHVPGNIQNDYARFCGWGPVGYGTNYEQYLETENWYWTYRTVLDFEANKGETIWFVSKGIDYMCTVLLNGNTVAEHEGMFSTIEVELTSIAKKSDTLEVRIHPHPKREGAQEGDRTQADASVKAPVCYSWDWHPRLLVSGIWDETYIETRPASYIRRCEPFVDLDNDLTRAHVRFEIECIAETQLTVYDAEGNIISDTPEFDIEHPHLWWCAGQGEPYLYTYTCSSAGHSVSGHFGVRKVSLVMNSGSWIEPRAFPKSRSDAPAQLVLNGRKVFLKGSNYVNPEIFNGEITDETLHSLVDLAKEANMNVFRCWGGSGISKQEFYEYCDQAGILLWVEFPLACNNYNAGKHYLEVLEQEASAIIKRLRHCPSVVLWCGGNELFNNWSGMTDQSDALRLLNKLCYELDFGKPFIMTSPLNGMGHGGYTFDDPDANCDCFTLFQNSSNTAYTEFGIPGMPDADVLRTFIPEDEIFPITRSKSWLAHHAFDAWGAERWLSLPTLEKYAPAPLDSLEKVVDMTQWLQREGYKAIFEEARRQAPHCAMAINWCWCEPWPCAVNNSLIAYPLIRKQGYYAVQSALRPALFSARIPKFLWNTGDRFTAEIWLLNDSVKPVTASADIYLTIGKERFDLLHWDVNSDTNKIGPSVNLVLPNFENERDMTLHIDAGEYSSEYRLCYRPLPTEVLKHYLNM